MLLALFAYTQTPIERDKCGFHLIDSKSHKSLQSTNNWGYAYDDLLSDIKVWKENPYVDIDTIGKSEQGRILFMLSIADKEMIEPKYRISVHARTHPNEVQAWHVTNEIIDLLINETETGNQLLSECVFNIIPMINPDGVEENRARENSNGVDIESNWGSSSPEAEVKALKSFFSKAMESELPINIALNMHSAYSCNRYFVYHHENGTSEQFAKDEKRFIKSIKYHFLEGFEDWDFYVSWENGTPKYYPESWFWNNYQENVMALTYEDMNCASASDYDKTAFAILNGIKDYLQIGSIASVHDFSDLQNIEIYPNPIIRGQEIKIKFDKSQTEPCLLKFCDINGKTILSKKILTNSEIESFAIPYVKSGIYFLQINSTKGIVNKKVILI